MTITCENIRVKGKISFLHIHKLEIQREANTHGVVIIHGISENEVKFNEIEDNISGSELSVVVLNDDKTEISTPLFSGLITNAEVKQENDLYDVTLEVKTGTVNLDRKPQSRSFQDVEKTYSSLVSETLTEKNGQVIFFAGQNNRIGNPIFRYEETDWQFTKRMAGYVGAPIIPDCVSPVPQVYFGYPQTGKEITLNHDFYVVKMDKRFYEYTGASKSNYLYYEFEDTNQHHFGDYTILQGRTYYICGIYAALIDGILKFRYTFGALPLITNQKIFNEKLSGVSLIGTITKTYGEMVEMNLDIDDAPTGSHPYKWTPVTGNTMYLMPEIGTKASLYFQSADDTSVLATDSPRTNGSLSKRPAPSTISETESNESSEAILSKLTEENQPESLEKESENPKIGFAGLIERFSNEDDESYSLVINTRSSKTLDSPASGSAGASVNNITVQMEGPFSNIAGSAPMSNPDHKQLRSEGGKELNLTSSEISFISKGLKLLIADGEGITVDSNKKIEMTATGPVSIKSKEISITAKSRIKAVKE